MNRQAADTLSDFVEFMKDSKSKADMPFDRFLEVYLPPGTLSTRRRAYIAEQIKAPYETHASYAAFFKDVSVNQDCSVFDTWGAIFFQKHCNMPFELYDWRIDRRTNGGMQQQHVKV